MFKFTKNIMSNVLFGIKINWRASKSLFTIKLLYTFLTAFVPIVISYIWRNILNELSSTAAGSMLLLVLLYICLKLFMYLSSVLNEYLIERYYDARTFYVNNLLISSLSRVDLSYFDSSEMSDRTERIRNNLTALHDAAWQVFDIISESVSVVVSITILSVFNPYLGFIILALSVPGIIYNQGHAKKMYKLNISQTRDIRLEKYYTESLYSVDSQYELKLNKYSPFFLSKAHEIWDRLFSINTSREEKHAIFHCYFTVLSVLGAIFTLLLSLQMVLDGLLGLGDLQFYFNMSITLQSQITALFNDMNGFLLNNAKIGEFRELMQEQAKKEESGTFILENNPRIEFCNVSFAYPLSETLVLNDCSFTIEPDEKVALIGLNGAGKTTILNLLFGFYYVREGMIKLNGINIKEYDIYSVRKVFGTLFQDYVPYCLPLREIIALPDFSQRFDEQRIEKAAKNSGFDNVIEGWVTRYDTVLGRYYASDGRSLSGGQWQLLSLARAYFQNAPLMVLDEPSASLDPVNEKRIFDQLYELSDGKGSIIITHQLANIKLADKILLLCDGCIKETGTHSELMDKKGLYAELFGLQAQKYAKKEQKQK